MGIAQQKLPLRGWRHGLPCACGAAVVPPVGDCVDCAQQQEEHAQATLQRERGGQKKQQVEDPAS